MAALPPGTDPPPPSSDPFEYTLTELLPHIAAELYPEHIAAFEEQEIDGRVLLKAASHEMLRDELRIRQYGRRDRILEIVEKLKRQSLKYAEFVRDTAIMVPLPMATNDEQFELQEPQIMPMFKPEPVEMKFVRRASIIGNEMAQIPKSEPQDGVEQLIQQPVSRFVASAQHRPGLQLLDPDRLNPLHITDPFAGGRRQRAWIDSNEQLRGTPQSSQEEWVGKQGNQMFCDGTEDFSWAAQENRQASVVQKEDRHAPLAETEDLQALVIQDKEVGNHQIPVVQDKKIEGMVVVAHSAVEQPREDFTKHFEEDIALSSDLRSELPEKTEPGMILG